jgi:rSAM/selenodomain-associated transferase 2
MAGPITAGMKLSIVIPTLNEATQLRDILEPLRAFQARGHEVIVVDGGSSDTTTAIAHEFAQRVIGSARGRACQMNAGAAAASGDVVLFLHADTYLPAQADVLIAAALCNEQKVWGRFDVRLSGDHFLLRVVELFMNLRSRTSSIATGDQAMFVRRAVFLQLGGFPDIPLMEDIALCKLLKRRFLPANLAARVVTSSRRWEQRGIIRTIVLMWRMRLAYALGASPHRLAQLYRE